MTEREEVPNLDCMPPDELRAWALEAMRDPRATAAKWGRPGWAPIVPPLVGYARKRARAMELRASGDVAAASDLEEQLDRLYRQLPRAARW